MVSGSTPESKKPAQTKPATERTKGMKLYLGIRDYEEALTWLRRIDEERSPEDSLQTFQIASNRYHDPALERPEFVGIRKSLALRQ